MRSRRKCIKIGEVLVVILYRLGSEDNERHELNADDMCLVVIRDQVGA